MIQFKSESMIKFRERGDKQLCYLYEFIASSNILQKDGVGANFIRCIIFRTI